VVVDFWVVVTSGSSRAASLAVSLNQCRIWPLLVSLLLPSSGK
jgi:hypothetical protein